MDEEIKTVEEQEANSDELKNAIEEQMRKLQRQNLMLGLRVAVKSVLDKICIFERMPGSKSANDYKRCIKDIKKFCETGLSRKVNTDGETEPINEETVQN